MRMLACALILAVVSVTVGKGQQKPLSRAHTHWVEPSAPPKGVKRVAILTWGLTRSLRWVLPSIKECIEDPLTSHGIEYDWFLHTYSLAHAYSNVRNGQKEVKLDNDEWKLLDIDPSRVRQEDQDTVLATLDRKRFRTMGDPWSNGFHSLDNFVLAMNSKLQVTEMFAEVAEQYDRVLYVRLDVWTLTPLRMSWLSSNATTVNVAGFDGYGGYNDRFLLAYPAAGLFWGRSFSRMEEYCNKELCHSEHLHRWLLDSAGFQVRQVPFYFQRMRPDGTLAPLDTWQSRHTDKYFLKGKFPKLPKVQRLHYCGTEWPQLEGPDSTLPPEGVRQHRTTSHLESI